MATLRFAHGGTVTPAPLGMIVSNAFTDRLGLHDREAYAHLRLIFTL